MQDQIASAFGGFNYMVFHQDGTFDVRPMTLPGGRVEALQSHLLLLFTGMSRTSADVARTIVSNLRVRASELTCLRQVVEDARDVLSAPDADLAEIGRLLHESWTLKRRLSDCVSNATVDDIYDTARRAGAVGGKLLGAGGGGFMLLFVRPEEPRVRLRGASRAHLGAVPVRACRRPHRREPAGRAIDHAMPIRYAYAGEGVEGIGRRARSHAVGLLVELYRRMLRIRRIEEEIERRYHQDQMKTPIHLVIGQEATAVGCCAALQERDLVYSSHRTHGVYLAKGGDLRAMLCEMHGRANGCVGSRGGSMHLIDKRVGMAGTSAIVGGAVPMATGAALAAWLKGEDRPSSWSSWATRRPKKA